MRTIRFHRLCFWPGKTRRTGDWKCERFSGWSLRPISWSSVAVRRALGKLSTGDELVGLTRAFIYAGTPSVVASLWSVDDSSTAHLMASFYRNLKTMSKVEALRQAQLELIRGEGRSDLLARRGVGGIGKLGETAKLRVCVSKPYLYFHFPSLLLGAVYFGGGWEMNSIPFPSRPLEPDHLTLVVPKALEQQRLNARCRDSLGGGRRTPSFDCRRERRDEGGR